MQEPTWWTAVRAADASAPWLRAEQTPRSIVPQRQIGFLREGYEASFLALDGNPPDDWGNIRRIKRRFKQGVEVPPPDR